MAGSDLRALIFMCGRGSDSYVRAALESVARQRFDRIHVLFVDDASTSQSSARTRRHLIDLLPGRHTYIRNAERWGKARNASVHLRAAVGESDFVGVVDADDSLVDVDILAEMSRRYEQGFDVVWTNYRTDQGRIGVNRALNPFMSPRGQGWVTSHFFSFRGSLLDAVPQAYFEDDDGEWFQSACDFALAYPILDQTRRYCFLRQIAYAYTASNPASHHNNDAQAHGLSSGQQIANALQVLGKTPLHCKRFTTDVPATFHSALAGQFASIDAALGQLGREVARVSAAVSRLPFAAAAVQSLTEGDDVPEQWLRAIGGWALDVEFIHYLRHILDRYESPRVLEFGSGRGSKVLAWLCARRGGSLVSVEHSQEWAQRTSSEISENGLSDTARVQLSPLVDVEFYGMAGRFYDMSWLTSHDRYDVVIVDGPPTDSGHLSRLPALPSIAAHLSSSGFHVFLDDYERDMERTVVEMWQHVAPDLQYVTLLFDKQVCQITP